MNGPLSGVRVVELAGLGPGPYGAMLLADLGAEVVSIKRPPGGVDLSWAMTGVSRGRSRLIADLKTEEGRELVLQLVEHADVLIEAFRPGVVERLGVGPDECTARNKRLVYARVSGYGQEGPMRDRAGHDINFLAIGGVLHGLGRAGSPPPPPHGYIGDFGGGGTFLALGVTAALVERASSGRGQVIDISVLDGVASLTAYSHGLASLGMWSDERGTNLGDGGRPYYDTYETADREFVAVGAMEPQFYQRLLTTLGLDPADWPQEAADRWPALRLRLTEIFAGRTRDEWAREFESVDACVTPVLRLSEAPLHPHSVNRGTFALEDGSWAPRAIPRFGRTPGVARASREVTPAEVIDRWRDGDHTK